MGRTLIQYAALPFRKQQEDVQVLLVTSRETKRWILPKGRPEKKIGARAVAAQEAFEEAGVAGAMSEKTIGGFPSFKRLPNGDEVSTWVRVYLLDVDTEFSEWPEKAERERKWIAAEEAASVVSEAGLAEFLRRFSASKS